MKNDFGDYLARKSESLDDAILEDIRFPTRQPDWWQTREIVRRLAEGQSFTESKKTKGIPCGWMAHVNTGRFPREQCLESTLDRFGSVWPKMSWKDADCVGAPCDPKK